MKLYILFIFHILCLNIISNVKKESKVNNKKHIVLDNNFDMEEVNYKRDKMSVFQKASVFLRLFVYFSCFAITFTFFLICLVICLFLPKNFSFFLAKAFSNVNMFLMKNILNISYDLRGFEKLPKNKCFILAPKHEGVWELFFFSYLIHDSVFIAKSEIFDIPLIGRFLKKIDVIPIYFDRKNNSERVIESAKVAVNENRVIVIYPEGQRVAPGQRVPIKSGAFALSKTLALDVYPVYLNAGKYCGFNLWSILYKPGKITIHCHDKIKYSDNLSKEELNNKLTQKINQNFGD